jgi:hypothetical protein
MYYTLTFTDLFFALRPVIMQNLFKWRSLICILLLQTGSVIYVLTFLFQWPLFETKIMKLYDQYHKQTLPLKIKMPWKCSEISIYGSWMYLSENIIQFPGSLNKPYTLYGPLHLSFSKSMVFFLTKSWTDISLHWLWSLLNGFYCIHHIT